MAFGGIASPVIRSYSVHIWPQCFQMEHRGTSHFGSMREKHVSLVAWI